MNILWSPESLQDLKTLIRFINEHHGDASVISKYIFESVLLLSRTPHIGRPGRVAGTRELIITDTAYIIPYRVKGDNLQILRVYHSSRRWPESF